ncbi:MAG: formylglycine-generating enzyme family protein [Planctomycetota bacterium]|nr:formylglycine-generating enzyme family protein [Planctomycetota bacterium]
MRWWFGAVVWMLGAVAYGAEGQAPRWPVWDGQESVEQYAKRVNLPTTKTLDLGNDVNLEHVLIPAGKIVMGTAEPESPWRGGAVLGSGCLVVAVLVAWVIRRAVRQHRRPQFSLRWLIAVVLIVGVAQYGGFRCWRAVQASRNFFWDESPAHAVTLTKAIYIGGCEVTQEQYEQVMGANPSQIKGARLPVERVCWDDAQEFCNKVREKTGLTVRLPTEAEWEFACRAGTTTTYYSGDAEADLGRAAWYSANSKNTTHPVGQKEPNAFGLHDMHGNVEEWCRNWHGVYMPEAEVDPQGPPEGDFGVLRGGDWGDDPEACRSAVRLSYSPGARDDEVGFRVVVEVEARKR